ncbi:hypothetical protein NUU61_007106 [Penicillium alfredii]|uniref:Uncharacterized protein n=1 Tax=Penicillium alfredii TaxID=1506179 RepID=A0A9W9K4F2_9EURO|nr:uncharacterized protein NUU61_007106 [Penicillium alfredii]KAJ5092236.1 hypothetical protein NUU61_007106 [Penicillium alfredii]
MARGGEEIQIHGKKRPAEGDPDGTQPLAKRFGCLQIDNHGPILARATHDNRQLLEQGDAMLLDDTKHTTYIHNLDQELANTDTPEDNLILLPLAERIISVPKSVLSNSTSPGKELVLCTEPSSLTVPVEQDSVRKAIIDTKARARAERMRTSNPTGSNPAPGKDTSETTESGSEDPMDLDYGF